MDGSVLYQVSLLCYYARKFEPDEVNEKSARRSNVFTILGERSGCITLDVRAL